VAALVDAVTGSGGGVCVLFGNGVGTFQAPRTFTAGRNPRSVAVGDFIGNGILDLAVADAAYQGGTPGVSVLLGNGDGTFQAAHLFATPGHVYSVVVGDFTGNGVLDLVLNADSGIRVLLGNGERSFQTTNFSYVPAGSTQTGSIAVGAFHGDGLPDLAVATPNAHSVFLLANDGRWVGGRGRVADGLSKTEPVLPGLMPDKVMRTEPGTAVTMLPPRATLPFADGSWSLLDADAEKYWTGAARRASSVVEAPAPVLGRTRAVGTTRRLKERLFATPEADLLPDHFAPEPAVAVS
jgi:hypothetical protein